MVGLNKLSLVIKSRLQLLKSEYFKLGYLIIYYFN